MMPEVDTGLGALRRVRAGVLDIAFHESGTADGPAVVLLHGFPYDVHAYTEVAPLLAAKGCRVVVPYLRGFGPTQFVDDATPRSGEQAALASDVLALLDALAIPRAVLAGYDWGGRAACVVAALHPARVAGLVSVDGYNIQDIANSARPLPPEQEHRYWYFHLFQSERGRAGLEADRRGLCRLLWRLWSPIWRFDDATFEQSAAAFDNPDFVDVVIHSYRHRLAAAPGDPALEGWERQLAGQPPITVPAVVLHGADDGVTSPHKPSLAGRFTRLLAERTVPGAGHNLPQERPDAFAQAVLELPP